MKLPTLPRRLRVRPSVLWAAAAALFPGRAAAQAQPDGITYREMQADGRRYQVVQVDLTQATLRLYWRDEQGRPYRTLAALDRALTARGETLLAATNAGIFYRTREPAGLHVERGTALRPLNRSRTPPAGEGPGNFFAQPNGVFYLARDGSAHVVTTAEATHRPGRMVEATQSGPLLLRDGVPHPLAGRADVARNAIAVCAPRRVALVLAPDGASIRQLALFVRDTLGCRDALYLDGTISGLRVPSARVDRDGAYVGMIGVTSRR